MKKLLAVLPVNFGHWVNWASDSGANREDWKDSYFQEIAFDFGWLPKNCYGRWVIEMKESNEKDTDIDVSLGWQKAVRDGGAGIITSMKGSEINLGKYGGINPDRQRRWELYESDYFLLPEHDGPVLLWLLRKHNDLNGILSVAMWSLAIFEDAPDEVHK